MSLLEHPDLADLGGEPRYPRSLAAHLAGLPIRTLNRWVDGYGYRRGAQPPVLAGPTPAAAVSFFDLLEARFVRAYRERGISLQSLRGALEYVGDALGVARPLLAVRFEHDGRQLFWGFQDESGDRGLVNGSRAGQATWPQLVDRYLHELEYEGDLAARWWPLGRDRGVVLDPRFGFGMPVVASRGVSTDVLAERWVADESISEIAEDFGLDEREVEDALRFEKVVTAA